jgi:hypothetical protein
METAEAVDAPALALATAEEMSFREIGERLNISYELARLDYNSALRKLETIGRLVETNDPDLIDDEELAEIAAALGLSPEEALARYNAEIGRLSKLTAALHMDNVRLAPPHYPVALRNRLRILQEQEELPEELPTVGLPDASAAA